MAVNRFDCPNASSGGLHDTNVYLNFCYHCDQIIDSRECLHRENEWNPWVLPGQYLCMHCGGAQETECGSVCPNCGNRNRSLLEMRGRSRIICSAEGCGYDSKNFVSQIEEQFTTLDLEDGLPF